MNNKIRKEFVNSIVSTLKIEGNVFNYGLVDDLINHIEVKQYRQFYNDLFGEDKRYLNGLDRVKEVSLNYADKLIEKGTNLSKIKVSRAKIKLEENQILKNGVVYTSISF